MAITTKSHVLDADDLEPGRLLAWVKTEFSFWKDVDWPMGTALLDFTSLLLRGLFSAISEAIEAHFKAVKEAFLEDKLANLLNCLLQDYFNEFRQALQSR